jgi:hypothetical protein
MRDGIAKYTKDKGRPPQSLNELVDTGYISHIPRDPVTNELDWVVVLYDCSASANCKQGIKDLHSASTAKSTKGSLYSVNKSQRLTDMWGNVVAGIELDPWGGETNRSWNSFYQPHLYTTWERGRVGWRPHPMFLSPMTPPAIALP